MIVRDEGNQVRWWTWAGGRANNLLAATLARVAPGLVDETDRFDNRYLRLHGNATGAKLTEALNTARDEFGDDLRGIQPDVSEEATRQLKFAELLPPDLAHDTLAARTADHETASEVARRATVTWSN